MSTTTITTSATRVVAAPAPTQPIKKTSTDRLRLRIDNNWYDLTNWKHLHPGGPQILEHLNGQDATDAFYSLHSPEAIARLSKMGKTAVTAADPAPIEEITAFRAFRADLEKQGWFQRSFLWDLFYMSSCYILASLGTYLGVIGHPVWAIVLIGLAMEQAGWIGHDFVHGRGSFCWYAGRTLGGFINAFSSSWWSNKHNTHHCYTNHVGVDADIENDPVFHLFFPTRENDVEFRRYQHLYFVPVASFIYVSWRIQSLQWAIKNRKYHELAFMVANYTWLSFLPWYVSIGSIMFGGMLVAVIVTASHQSEEMFEGSDLQDPNKAYNFIRTQFESTRDAVASNFFLEWLWGGMQYQLEHHLFPTLPKYYYASLAPKVEKWAKENGLPYKSETEWQILKRNYETLKFYAGQPAVAPAAAAH